MSLNQLPHWLEGSDDYIMYFRAIEFQLPPQAFANRTACAAALQVYYESLAAKDHVDRVEYDRYERWLQQRRDATQELFTGFVFVFTF